MFRGINTVNIDEKGRIAVPTRYRDGLKRAGAQLILTIDTEERCLLLYPLSTWEEIEAKLAALPSLNPAARRIQRLLLGHATDVEMDGQGRLLLPPSLREYATLTKHAVLVGQGKKFEVWDEDHWHRCRDQWMQAVNGDPSLLPEEIKSISL